METQRNNPDQNQDRLQKLQKALRDNNRLDQMNQESQGFSISKIDTKTLNKLDQYTSLTKSTDEHWLPAVDITCNNGYTIQYKDPSTGKMVYTSSINLDSKTKSIETEGMLKGIVDNTKRDGPTNGSRFSLTSKDGTRETFTIMDNASADRAREADMRTEINDEPNNQFSIEDIDQNTLQVLRQYVDIEQRSDKITLTFKKPFAATIESSGGRKPPIYLESGRTVSIPSSVESLKVQPGRPKSGEKSFTLKNSDWTEQYLHISKPLGQ